jgi:hypothetical protein
VDQNGLAEEVHEINYHEHEERNLPMPPCSFVLSYHTAYYAVLQLQGTGWFPTNGYEYAT